MSRARFSLDGDDDPGKAEVWALTQDGNTVTLGWRKGSRWIAVSNEGTGETNIVQLTLEQMRQLGEIACRL